ncbi:uncharacterized protein LOC126380931 [Pectinophora gossypiella]|uniref:uncharacterized protein LOC126380931 n=1 Tax=Pectinophora gossypiella TaxID=13191 RepID=UPI00214EF2CC|nr:uncharacterized protein LOC126380931 [Pectinophora gossypiella]
MNLIRLLSPIKRPPICKIFSVNYVSQHPLKFLETQDRWRQKDNIPRQYDLIYKAPMGKWLNLATAYLTVSTTTIGCLGAYYGAFVFNVAEMNNVVTIGDDIVIADSGLECLTYLGAFVMFHAAVKVLLAKYVVRLYQDGDNYIAVYLGHWYNVIQKHKFKHGEVKKLKPTYVVSWGKSRYSLGNKHAILLEDYFKTPEYFNNLLPKEKEPEENK